MVKWWSWSRSVDGGEGVDTTAYFNSDAGVDVDLAKGVGKGFAEGDTFKDIENVRGSTFDDKITGSDDNNRILLKQVMTPLMQAKVMILYLVVKETIF